MERIRCWFLKRISKDGTGRGIKNIQREEGGKTITLGKIIELEGR